MKTFNLLNLFSREDKHHSVKMIEHAFAMFMIVLMMISNIPITVISEENKTLSCDYDDKYKVTITYEDSASIPDNSTLHVEEYDNSDEENESYYERTKEILEWEESDFNVYSFLNIYIVDEEGNVVIPKSKVKVNVQLLDEKEDETIDNTQVVVLNEENNGVIVNGKDEDAVVNENTEFQVEFTDEDTENETSFPVLALAQTVKEKVIKASDDNNYVIKVTYDSSANIPLDAELNVEEVAVQNYINESLEALNIIENNISFSYAFDITIVDPATGEKYQPDSNVKVSIELLNETIDDKTDIGVLHVTEEDDNKQTELLTTDVNKDTVEFSTDGFSVYVVVGYTVDFHWDGYTYKMEGEGSILLSELLNKLGIDIIGITDIAEVSFSNENLLSVEKLENDWRLTSLSSFDTNEELSLKLTNGETVKITVTDPAELPADGTWENGTSGNGTWSISADGVMTLSGTGRMPDFAGVKDTPWNPWRQQITKLVVEDGITYLSSNMLTRAYNLKEIDASGCTTLEATGTDLFKMNNFDGESGTGLLETVNFSGNTNFTSFGYKAFQACTKIKSINLSDTKIDQNVITYNFDNHNEGAKLRNVLEEIIVQNCTNITNLDLRNYTKLQTVDLRGCTGFTANDSIRIDNANNNKTLKNLYFSDNITNNRIKVVDVSGLTVYFDGTLSEWLNNGFSYNEGKWSKRNVLFLTVFEVTGADGEELYYNAGTSETPKYQKAQFNTLKESYDSLDSLCVDSQGTPYEGEIARIVLLKDKYEMADTDAIEFNNSLKIILTSDSEEEATGVISYGNISDDKYMFNIGNCDLSFENITIDGTKADNASKGGIAYISSGISSLTIEEGTTIQNGGESGEGAIYINNGSLTMNGGSISGCPDDSSAVYVANENARLYFSGSPVVSGNNRNIDLSSVENKYTNEIINVNEPLDKAQIGLYITDDEHNSIGESFGISSKEGATNGLACFVNDDNGLIGWPASYGSAGDVIWSAPLKVKFVDMNASGDFSSLNPETYPDKSIGISTEWKNKQSIIDDYFGSANSSIPIVIDKSFYWYAGVGPSDSGNVSNLNKKELTDNFYLKKTDSDLLFSTDGSGEGEQLENADTVFVIYSKEKPAGSGKIELWNNTALNLNISNIETTGSDHPVIIVVDDDGTLFVLESGLTIGTSEKAEFVILDEAGEDKEFRLVGGFLGDKPSGLEVKYTVTDPGTTVYLYDEDIVTLPETIKGNLIETDPVSVVFTSELLCNITVVKNWIDSTVPEGTDKSNGNTSITLEFYDNLEELVLVRSDANEHNAGVSVDETHRRVVLNRIEGEWPSSWTVTVPDTAVSVKEVLISDKEIKAVGYVNTETTFEDDDISITNQRAICKIGDELFFSLNAAVQYAQDNSIYQPKIEMLLDYTMPQSDFLDIPEGYDVTIKTADEGFDGQGDKAVITRASDFSGNYMFRNDYSTLAFENITLDGNNVQTSYAMIKNNGTLKIDEGTSFKNVQSTGNGGVIYAEDGSITINGNQSPVVFNSNSAVNGAVIYASGGTVTISNAVFDENTATGNGGVIYYSGNDAISINENTEIRNNNAVDGGAIYQTAGLLTISEGAELSSNTATNNGGAICSESAVIEIANSVLSSNEAANNGGAIYATSGSITLFGNEQLISNNHSGKNGGAIYSESGYVVFTGVPKLAEDEDNNPVITGNSASNYGGAFYIGSGHLEVTNSGRYLSAGDIVSNSANNGFAIFVNSGEVEFDSGTITGNNANENGNGGAIGLGSINAKLYFTNDVVISGNKKGNEERNIFLDQDSDEIINSNMLGDNANIGVYVPGDMKAVLFKNRGSVGAKFGIYADVETSSANLHNFKNDRLTELKAMAETVTKRIIWGYSLSVEVRYRDVYSNYPEGFPPNSQDQVKYTETHYYPPSSSISASQIADDLYNSFSSQLPVTAAYGGAFADINDSFDKYITDVEWDNEEGSWTLIRCDGSKTESDKLIIYYSEPSYISIENNSDDDLTIDQGMTISGKIVVNSSSNAGYGFVVAKNGATQESLMPVVTGDLALPAHSSIKFMFPGACSTKTVKTNYELEADFVNPSEDEISLIRTGHDEEMIDPKLHISLNDILPTDKGGTYEIIFGGRKPICKITTGSIIETSAEDLVVDKYEVEGSAEYTFPTISAAVEFAKKCHEILGNEITIGMLTDYLLPSSDKNSNSGISFPKDYKFTLNTASEGHFKYSGSRATISRDSGNRNPFFSVPQGSENTEFNISNLILDGRNLAGNTDGGALKSLDCKVTLSNTKFTNFIANNGGGVYVEFKITDHYNEYDDDEGHHKQYINSTFDIGDKATLRVDQCEFNNCVSNSTKQRQGGGAIWTIAKEMYLSDTKIISCKASDQGGGVFHRMDRYIEGTLSQVTSCTFIDCEAKAAGAFESDVTEVIFDAKDNAEGTGKIRNSVKNCRATERNGGGVNVYSNNSATTAEPSTVNISYTDFEDCHSVYDSNVKYGGALRSAARETTVSDCSFKNSFSLNGGGVSISNDKGDTATIRNCSFDNCGAVYSYNLPDQSGRGGAIFCLSKELTIENVKIDNCYARVSKEGINGGGGVFHGNSGNVGTTLHLNNSVISNSTSGTTGGGLYSFARAITISDSDIINNSAEGNGGGICCNNTNTVLIIEGNKKIKNNTSKGQGGGVYANCKLTLRNGIAIENNSLLAGSAENGAGVYLTNTLTVGSQDYSKDLISVKNNYTIGGKSSNLRLKENNGKNATDSVAVLCNLDENSYIGVINPRYQGDQFGSSAIKGPSGFSDLTHVFTADDGSLYGIIDRTDTSGKKLIWAGLPICKITDENGNLLFYKPVYASDNYVVPAVFDYLDNGSTSASSGRAFSLLRSDNLSFSYENGETYSGEVYQVKMLVENYNAKKHINTANKNDRSIIFTTAKETTGLFPYRGKPGTNATINRDNQNMGNNNMMTVRCNLTLKDITLDSNNFEGDNSRILNIIDNPNLKVIVGRNAVLKNAKLICKEDGTDGDGGAIRINNGYLEIDGGTIMNCSAGNNGGAVYKNTGTGTLIIKNNASISNCSALNGGALYLVKGTTDISSGSISDCAATNGGAIFVSSSVVPYTVLNISGGKISGNSASGKGGGIALSDVNANAKLNFSGSAYVHDNYLNGKQCNVQLGYDSNNIINSTGINSSALIGVYVTDGANLFDKHGASGMPFGKYDNTDIVNLRFFVNDRNGLKGGVPIDGIANTIYWIENFSLEVSKRVESDEYSDLHNEVFGFTITLDKRINGKYGDITFLNGYATITLKNGQKKTADDLPIGANYTVREDLSSERKEYYSTDPGLIQKGKIGENLNNAEAVSKYKSPVEFVNIHGSRTVILRKVDGSSCSHEKAYKLVRFR